MPTPSGLVSANTSPGRAPALVKIRSGWISSHHSQAILGFVVVYCVTAGQHATRFAHFFRAAAQNVGDNLWGQVGGKAADVKRERHLAAHGVYIAHRVRGGNRAIVVGIVHRRREKVERLDDGDLVADFIDCRVVADL
jgi:hypothetical protein